MGMRIYANCVTVVNLEKLFKIYPELKTDYINGTLPRSGCSQHP